MDIENNNNTIDTEKLRAAKEKLACHIIPPWEREVHASAGGDSSCGTDAGTVRTDSDRVRLTQMTSAGG